MSKPFDDTITQARLVALHSLPPLPRHSQALLQLLADPDLDILQLIELIEQTPVLAARVMGVASSALFNRREPPRTVADAVMRVLGLTLVRDLSLSLILSAPFDMHRCRSFDGLLYWRQAMLTATLAQRLAAVASLADGAELQAAYLAGLLHSLGMLALADVVPETLDQLLRQHLSDDALALSTLQYDAFGLDYAAAGELVGRAWGLPSALIAVMASHRDPDYQGPHRALVGVTRIADCAASAHLRGAGPDSCIDAVGADLVRLGITSGGWQRALQHWPEDVSQVEQLARLFARGAA